MGVRASTDVETSTMEVNSELLVTYLSSDYVYDVLTPKPSGQDEDDMHKADLRRQALPSGPQKL